MSILIRFAVGEGGIIVEGRVIDGGEGTSPGAVVAMVAAMVMMGAVGCAVGSRGRGGALSV